MRIFSVAVLLAILYVTGSNDIHQPVMVGNILVILFLGVVVALAWHSGRREHA